MEYLVTIRDEQDQYNVNVTFLMELRNGSMGKVYMADVIYALDLLNEKWEDHVVPIDTYRDARKLLLRHHSLDKVLINPPNEVGRYMKSLSIRVPERVKV